MAQSQNQKKKDPGKPEKNEDSRGGKFGPMNRGGSLDEVKNGKPASAPKNADKKSNQAPENCERDAVDEASWESFPASDPPAH